MDRPILHIQRDVFISSRFIEFLNDNHIRFIRSNATTVPNSYILSGYDYDMLGWLDFKILYIDNVSDQTVYEIVYRYQGYQCCGGGLPPFRHEPRQSQPSEYIVAEIIK